ncbi:MAG: type IV toxin-antitoxin system AbiEi family antitoxin [Tannerella sp.]|nr:type IV toxin-antitoxin system AbiEi family antitoxin [Tannerella sp.]
MEINKTRINTLIQSLPRGTVLLPSWLLSQGYSYELQQCYRKGGWLKSIGKGAMLKSNDPFVLAGALSALQKFAQVNIHVGGRSALELQGVAHYLQINSHETTLFVNGNIKLPRWFTNNEWDTKTRLFRLSLFDDETMGMADFKDGEQTMKISNLDRAIMECIALCPAQFPLSEAYELMEGLSGLRPAKVQQLLEKCKSVKVKRLFLYFAEKAEHGWFKYLDVKKIDLGAGNRSLTGSGVLIPKYKLILPEELV